MSLSKEHNPIGMSAPPFFCTNFLAYVMLLDLAVAARYSPVNATFSYILVDFALIYSPLSLTVPFVATFPRTFDSPQEVEGVPFYFILLYYDIVWASVFGPLLGSTAPLRVPSNAPVATQRQCWRSGWSARWPLWRWPSCCGPPDGSNISRALRRPPSGGGRSVTLP